MSTHKHFDKICCVVLALTLIITVAFVNAERFGVQKISTQAEYEKALFDTSRVHTINIIMDDWDDFTENAKSEEYYNCTVVIDNEAYRNVAIRGKGNTSLSSVNNDRYSYKIEFDHYDSTNTYYGLDKLCLNNIIQDNTYMKDYLTYTMMRDMGVASPLCSYAYITVNGEEWGLYLAVEGVEESFLQRNYGKDYGELYKPDSMSMGGGRGNGDKFDMDVFMQKSDETETTAPTQIPQTTQIAEESTTIIEESQVTDVVTTNPYETTQEQTTNATTTATTTATTNTQQTTTFNPADLPDGVAPPNFNGENPFEGQFPGGAPPDFNGELPEGVTIPDFNGENPFGGNNPFGGDNPFGGNNPFGGSAPEGMAPPNFSGASKTNDLSYTISGMSKTNNTTEATNNSDPQIPADFDPSSMFGGELPEGMTIPDFNGENPFGGQMPEGVFPQIDENGEFQMPANFTDVMGGFGGMGSTDVKLKYSDDEFSSYSNIFNNAKTDITRTDKTRLIEALKKLSNPEDLEGTVDVEAVIRYFVVHNFVVNADSYTGTMIHNYYLYENDGQMQMIPWDYNLAFGSFMSMGNATGSVNDPIDTPLSVSGNGDRPMIDWIFSSDEYTQLYHKYFSEFMAEYFDNGYLETLIDNTVSMISPYVEKDPTKFCAYDEFQKGAATLKEFCLLRAESVKGQLDGSIGKTSATQKSDTLVDASDLDTSVMGSMGGGKGGMDFPGGDKISESLKGDSAENYVKPENATGTESAPNTEDTQNTADSNNTESAPNKEKERPQMPGDFNGGGRPGFQAGNSNSQGDGQMERPGGFSPDKAQSSPETAISVQSIIFTIASIIVLGIGIAIAFNFKRRKK